MENKQTKNKNKTTNNILHLGRIIKCKNTRSETTGKVASVKGKI